MEILNNSSKQVGIKEGESESEHNGKSRKINQIHFLFEEHTSFPDKEQMLDILKKHFGKLLYFSSDEKILGFAAEDYAAELRDGEKIPVMIQLTDCYDATKYQLDDITLSQMQWSCPKCREILDSCKYHMVAFDMLGDNLQDYKKRADLIVRMTEAFIEMFPACKAVLFEHSGKMHTRESILNCNMPEEHKFIEYAVNIRLFNIQGTGDMLIDSVGMDTLHLPDVQYHFHGIDPNWIVNHAYDLLWYIYVNNPEFEPNDTIDGIRDGKINAAEKWKVNYENSLIQPMRLVLDLDLGVYASGEKEGEKLMEENKVLIEEEEEQVSGGASVEYAAQPMRLFCPKCNSSDITTKSFAYNGNHQMTALLHCNSCGNEWKTLAKKLGPGYGQNSN